MKRVACVVVVVLTAAAGAAAKQGVHAHLLGTLPKQAAPGSVVVVRWSVDVPGPHGTREGLSAIGMFVRLVGPGGVSTTAMSRENVGPPYSARIPVPPGGIRGVRFGVAGSPPSYFPLR